MPSAGTVRQWSDDEGWGVIDSAETPGGCWAHFSMIVADGYRRLSPDDHVTFSYEAPGQDGFGYRAVLVWPAGTPELPPPESPGQPSAAYQSSLTVRWPDGRVTRGRPPPGGHEPR